MKVLHIANWYPNKWDDLQGVFIKEQYKVFSEVTDSHLINVQVRDGKKVIEYEYIKYSENEEGYYLLTKIKSNKVIELLTTLLFLWALIKTNYKKYNLLHIHIAYPLLIHYFIWKRIIKLPVIISEHWSAYHFNFYIPKKSKKLDGIKRIFRQGIPIITVSNALKSDIEDFSNIKITPSIVIPNVLKVKKTSSRKNYNKDDISTFFIVNIWTDIKNPFPLLEGFLELSKLKKTFHLKIGGDGVLIPKMKQFVHDNNLEKYVTFLGRMNQEEIKNTYLMSNAYLFASKYETFSVVSAEALCYGIPLIGPKIPAILEYTRQEDIVTIDEHTSRSWLQGLNSFIEKKETYNQEEISQYYRSYFSIKKIQNRYKDTINDWIK